MDEVLKIVVMGRACRNTANIKNRQPIGNDVRESSVCSCRSSIVEIIEDELNVKKVAFTDDVRAFTHATPSSRSCSTVGPKYGKLLRTDPESTLQRWTATRRWMNLKANGVLALLSVDGSLSSWQRRIC